ncbi:MAG: hypothetical protein KJZ93_13170 [Caldilineaceae bacterium]|nr:hypothetical protein [Caldilineaceae bacterium]
MDGSSLLASGEEVKTIIGLTQALTESLCVDEFVSPDHLQALRKSWSISFVGVNESAREVDWRQAVGLEVAERKGGKWRPSRQEVRQSQMSAQPRAWNVL